ncbi:hypothetical protein H6G54_10740 [Anabaena cylindrica FACHB-243]|uniref:Uncharacterized protein n=1 Tax=Anabaena cylindrica (strain ATCC 27899 / PCC 7122) TaxID=272123 RepID=K9ZB00_ANACC|nr:MULTISPECIES: hypothetical protein [Anabaena]AFZ56378.1 hypothetical protein Anacy_0795 [Anabaena cylindrica PCC 7122]MBD2418174.1 hypothetical protein [Anabaena cylindrica FACHB-243]MBY5282018.1 hypothetical protein [Anabaena sp. CCAP 1446/1C]MBY5309290.1 hypothetical protein [Anabaena sp. CCAP 1446/1C]MCM2409104.1 hypothetical protein [Anabaena sp. CCAP 1446/1C]
MDIALIVKFLAPCLPFLLTMGNKAAEGASQKIGEDGWNRAKMIWAKLQPKVEAKEAAKEAAEDVAKNPDDEDLQVSLRVQLKKILEADTALAEEIAKILQAGTSDSGSSSVNAQSYDESTQINAGRDVVNPNLSRTYNNSPK